MRMNSEFSSISSTNYIVRYSLFTDIDNAETIRHRHWSWHDVLVRWCVHARQSGDHSERSGYVKMKLLILSTLFLLWNKYNLQLMLLECTNTKWIKCAILSEANIN